ncbi:MAG: SMC-Scp complex subunit ScpB [Acidobacteriota bacterium]|nr:SMC-Scp complex subunit ScpB [Acidobacteriota bacterium]
MRSSEERTAGNGTELVALLEALLFASTEPVTEDELHESLPDYSAEDVDRGLTELASALERPSRGLSLQKIAGGYRLVTRAELADRLRRLFQLRNRKRLTPATLDVLSIVAYAQPITAPEIHEIRGTDPAYALGVLQERRLLRVVGRKRVVGRPMLYGTTKEFLVHFGLDRLDDLPPVEAYGTHVVPTQQRLFPVTGEPSDARELELFDETDGADPAANPPLQGGETEAGNVAAGAELVLASPPSAPSEERSLTSLAAERSDG